MVSPEYFWVRLRLGSLRWLPEFSSAMRRNRRIPPSGSALSLSAAGVENYLAWRGEADRLSSDRDIDAALAGAEILLILRSAAADSSRQVIGELQRAKLRGLRVATVRLEPLAASGPLVDGLQQLVMLDAFPPLANHLASIVSALQSLPNAPTAPSGAAIADTTWSGSIGPPAPSVAGPAPIADTMWQGEPQSIEGATPQSQIPHPPAPAAASGTPIADTHWSGTVPPVKSVAGPAPVADTMWKGEPQSIDNAALQLSMAQWPATPGPHLPAPSVEKPQPAPAPQPTPAPQPPPASPDAEATLPFEGPPPRMDPLPRLPSTGSFNPPSGPPPAPSSMSDGVDELREHGSIDAPPRPGIIGKIEHYDLFRKLGEGGMGIVLLARDTRNDSLVAMKTMRPRYAASAQARHRFVVEARHMERMNHPNVLKVLEVCDSPQACYYTMPLVSGGSLATQMGSGDPMFPDTVVRIGRQVADALRYAHDQAGVIHRDIKPQNVLMDAGGHALLSDFGLVRTLFNDTVIDDQPRSWTVGTGPYMPPEIVAGNAGDTRADIYSFGAMLYEMACGKSPYNGQSTEEVLTKIKLGPPPPIMQVNPAVPPALVKVIEGCMGRELRDRYAHMADVAEDLRRVQAGQSPLGPHGALPPNMATTSKRPDRVAALKKLFEDEKISPDQLAEGRNLLRDGAESDETARQKQTIYADLADGKLDPDYLKSALDSIETPERRNARLAKEAAAKTEMKKRAKITALLAAARDSANVEHFPDAFAALDEVLKLDPANSDARTLRKRIEKLQADPGRVQAAQPRLEPHGTPRPPAGVSAPVAAPAPVPVAVIPARRRSPDLVLRMAALAVVVLGVVGRS